MAFSPTKQNAPGFTCWACVYWTPSIELVLYLVQTRTRQRKSQVEMARKTKVLRNQFLVCLTRWPLIQGRRKASELWNNKLAKSAIATVSEQGRKHVEPVRLFCQGGSGMRSEDLPVGQHKAWEKWLDSREFSKYSPEETLMHQIWVILTEKKKK